MQSTRGVGLRPPPEGAETDGLTSASQTTDPEYRTTSAAGCSSRISRPRRAAPASAYLCHMASCVSIEAKSCLRAIGEAQCSRSLFPRSALKARAAVTGDASVRSFDVRTPLVIAALLLVSQASESH